MSRALAASVLLLAGVAAATPSGHRWGMNACSGSASCLGSETCSGGRCLPSWRIADTIANRGGVTLNGGVAYSTVKSRTVTIFKRWTTSQVTNCSTSWDSVYGSTFTNQQGLSAVNANDTTNNVIWLQGGDWRYSTTTLGLTTTTFYTSSGQIIDADMELNNNVLWADGAQANAYDFESVVLHEAGHFLGLDHTGSSLAVMYPDVQPNEAKRVLQMPDTADVCTVYAALGGQGSPCTSATTCTSGLVCEGVSGSTAKICTQDCTGAGQPCPTGFACQASTSGFACLPQVGAADHCAFCSRGQDCSTGICARDESQGLTWCTSSCTQTAQCPAGNTCQTTASGGLCVPDAPCPGQCSSASDCPVGYLCQSGMCFPTGNAGDRCEVSAFCKTAANGPCSVCVTEPSSPSIAFCRSCCQGNSNGGFCQGCQLTTCTAPQTCIGLTNNQDGVCLATGTLPSECEPCASGNCAAGLVCVAGRCHGSCNPSNPGSCTACFNLGNGSGACACPNEVVHEGEPCGVIAGNQIAVCQAGLTCTGSPQALCRAQCNAQDPNSCPSGQVCQLSGTVAVCVPGTAGAKCAPCSNSGACNAGLTCYLGRCYEPCNVNVGTTCATCVQTELSGVGVCGCSDQVAGENEACGSQPQVMACTSGTVCIEGNCRAECDPAAPFNCPSLTDCRAYNGRYFCQAQEGSGGGSGAGGGTGGASGAGGGRTQRTGGGTGGSGTVSDEGCGCGATASPFFLWPALAFALRRRRR